MEPDDPAAEHAEGASLGHDDWPEEQCVHHRCTCQPQFVAECSFCPRRAADSGLAGTIDCWPRSTPSTILLRRLPALDSQQAAEHGDELAYGQDDYSEFELVRACENSLSCKL